MENKTLFQTEYFDVIDVDGYIAVDPKELNVVVFPYVIGETGLPEKVGIYHEKNPIRKGGFHTTLVTGTADEQDADVLATAIRELKEESGYDVTDTDRWTYLGPITHSKMVKQEQPGFSVDITGLVPGPVVGDGSVYEQESEFKIVSIKEALQSSDVYIPTLFIRIFKHVFGIDYFNK